MKRTRLQRKTRLRAKSKKAIKEKALDDLSRQLIFARDGHKCLICGKTKPIQWCHVVTSRYRSLRWRMENVMTLCAGHHRWWHDQPVAASDWWSSKYPERKLALKETSPWAVNGRIDRRLAMAYLTELKERLTTQETV